MRAAVVTSFGAPPACQDIPVPAPRASGEAVVDVIAAGLHPRVRSQASGSHYTSTGELPLVPGIDGVCRAPDGTLRYVVLPDTTMGTMAEQTVADLRRSVVLPEDSDPVLIAAAMNPAMSSWVALRRRARLSAGQSVLILAATGSAGRLAIQVARHLGAGRVIAAGRDPERLAGLPALGADVTISLDGDLAENARRIGAAAADADVVLDYLWGPLSAAAMRAIAISRADPGQQLTWVEIGSVGGPEAAIPSAALRAVRLHIIGSGQGSVPARDIVAELPALAAEITAGTFRIDARAVPLAGVTAAWADAASEQRIVIMP
jgi:NADPH:quinone reductase-like Zn-dependent oxidoreductase